MFKEIPGRNAPCLRTHLIAAWNEKKKNEWMKRPAVSTTKKRDRSYFPQNFDSLCMQRKIALACDVSLSLLVFFSATMLAYKKETTRT